MKIEPNYVQKPNTLLELFWVVLAGVSVRLVAAAAGIAKLGPDPTPIPG